MAIGTLLHGLLTGLASLVRCILTGSTFNLPRPLNTSLNLSSISSLVRPEDIDVGLDASSIDVWPCSY